MELHMQHASVAVPDAKKATQDATLNNASTTSEIDTSQMVFTPLQFHGDTKTFFRIWIVNTLLTIVTLGIYSAWATVRTNRYIYGNTELNGHRFAYLAEPMQILKGRLIGAAVLCSYVILTSFSPIAAGALGLVLSALTPILIVMGLRFRLRMTAYRNVRFGFKGKFGRAFVVFSLFPLLSAFTVGLALPWVLKKMSEFLYSNISFGDRTMQSALSNRTYYKTCLLGILVGFPVFLVSVIFMGFAFSGSLTDFSDQINFSLLILLISVNYIACFIVISSFYIARTREHIFENSEIEGVARFRSEVGFLSLAWLQMSNFIAVIATLGLAYPWTKIRSARFWSTMSSVNVLPGAEQVIAHEQDKTDSIADEVAGVLDVDVSLG